MKSCLAITQVLSESRERELTVGERMELKMHLAICSKCKTFAKQLDVLDEVAKTYRSDDRRT